MQIFRKLIQKLLHKTHWITSTKVVVRDNNSQTFETLFVLMMISLSDDDGGDGIT